MRSGEQRVLQHGGRGSTLTLRICLRRVAAPQEAPPW